MIAAMWAWRSPRLERPRQSCGRRRPLKPFHKERVMQMRFAAMATFAAAAMALGASANATVLFNDDFSQDTLTEHPALQGGEVGLKWQTRTPVIPSGDPNIPSSPDHAH